MIYTDLQNTKCMVNCLTSPKIAGIFLLCVSSLKVYTESVLRNIPDYTWILSWEKGRKKAHILKVKSCAKKCFSNKREVENKQNAVHKNLENTVTSGKTVFHIIYI